MDSRHLERFLLEWEELGPRHRLTSAAHLRLSRALGQPGPWTVERLRQTLRPLLCWDPDSQGRFDALFEDHFEPGEARLRAPSPDLDSAKAIAELTGIKELTSPGEHRRPSTPGTAQRPAPRPRSPQTQAQGGRRPLTLPRPWAIGLGLAALAAALALMIGPTLPWPDSTPVAVAPAAPPMDVSTPTPNSLGAEPASLTRQRPLWTVGELTLVAAQPESRLSPRVLLPLLSGLLFLGHLALLALALVRLRVRCPPPSTDPDLQEIYRPRLPHRPSPPLFQPATLDRLADSLGYVASPLDTDALDVDATVGATCREGGIPTLRFQRRQMGRRLLLLVDDAAQRRPRDRRVVDELARGLRRRGVPLSLVYFDRRGEGIVGVELPHLSLETLEEEHERWITLGVGAAARLHAPGGRGRRQVALLRRLAAWRCTRWLELDPTERTPPLVRDPSGVDLPAFPASDPGLQRLAADLVTGSRGPTSPAPFEVTPPPRAPGPELKAWLGAALPWLAQCALIQPLDLAMVHGLRQAASHLAPEALDRLLLHPMISLSGDRLQIAPPLERWLLGWMLAEHPRAAIDGCGQLRGWLERSPPPKPQDLPPETRTLTQATYESVLAWLELVEAMARRDPRRADAALRRLEGLRAAGGAGAWIADRVQGLAQWVPERIERSPDIEWSAVSQRLGDLIRPGVGVRHIGALRVSKPRRGTRRGLAFQGALVVAIALLAQRAGASRVGEEASTIEISIAERAASEGWGFMQLYQRDREAQGAGAVGADPRGCPAAAGCRSLSKLQGLESVRRLIVGDVGPGAYELVLWGPGGRSSRTEALNEPGYYVWNPSLNERALPCEETLVPGGLERHRCTSGSPLNAWGLRSSLATAEEAPRPLALAFVRFGEAREEEARRLTEHLLLSGSADEVYLGSDALAPSLWGAALSDWAGVEAHTSLAIAELHGGDALPSLLREPIEEAQGAGLVMASVTPEALDAVLATLDPPEAGPARLTPLREVLGGEGEGLGDPVYLLRPERSESRPGALRLSGSPADGGVSLRSLGETGDAPLALTLPLGTPLISDLPPGRYELSGSAPGYESQTQTLTIRAGRELEIQLHLRALASLAIEGAPEGASLTLVDAGGARQSGQPGDTFADLAIGDWTLSAEATGCEPYRTSGSLGPGEAKTLRVELSCGGPEPGGPFPWVRIPAGTFEMGSEDGSSDERPVHTVTLKAFEMWETEVTVAQYGGCVEAGSCDPPSRDYEACTWEKEGLEQHPTNCIDWSRARAFCQWAGGRLPSEAEWEYAARGTDGREYPWGDQAPTAQLANSGGSRDGYSSTAPVRSFPAGRSPFGLHDMSGNLWEWVEDCYKNDYSGAPADGSARTDICTDGSSRVIRGGSFLYNGGNLRAPDRGGWHPGGAGGGVGVRCSRSLP